MTHIYSENEYIRPEIHRDHLDIKSGWLTARYEIIIKRTPDDIWEYVYDPKIWTASNPDEHMGLTFFNETNRPETGVAFHQRERVSGIYADLRGHILYVERPRICVWNGVARYRILGVIPLKVAEAGVVRLEKSTGGVLASHTVFLHIPKGLFGRLFFSGSGTIRQKSWVYAAYI